eukprot:17950-Heterococcus_DN1.PRE.1
MLYVAARHGSRAAASAMLRTQGAKALPLVQQQLALRNSKRLMSSYKFGSNAVFMDQWPISVANTVVNVCPQGERMVVERLGKLHSIHESGWFIAVPVLDKIAYRVDMRERSIVIDPQSAITKDNVSVEVSGNLYVQFVDPEKAAYGSKNPLYS